MTALQRISASIKRRRSSVIGNSLASELEDHHEAERRNLLNEAKAFIGQTQAGGGGGGGERLGIEELKLLLFLTDMLECSLLNLPPSAAEKQQQQHQSQRRKFSSTEKPNNSNTNNNDNNNSNNNSNSGCYTTWAAGGTQGQQHRRQRKMMMFNKLSIQQQQLPQEHQQQMSVGNMPSLSMMELGLGMGTIHEEEHEHHHPPPPIGIGGMEGKTGTTMERGKAPLEEEGELEDAFSLPSAEPGELIVYEEADPLFVTLIPHICLVLSAIAYMLLGSLAYRWFDPEIGAKPSARSFIWSFQLLATIGWGDSHASTVFSQAFTVVYICVGIPMLFSAYANFGRLLTEFCCLQGPLLWQKLFGPSTKDSGDLANPPFAGDVVQRLPLIIISNLLILHQCIGLLIYSFWLKDWPIISTVYFSITTMATSGFGDFHPDTDSWFETIIAVLYISVGIVLLSALFLTIALYYQAIHYIHLKENCVGPIYGHLLRLAKGGENSKKAQAGKQQIP